MAVNVQLVAAWLMEKNNNNQQEVLREALVLLAEVGAVPVEFKTWAENQKVRVAAVATPEALDALRLEREQQLTADLAALDEVLTATVPKETP